MSMLPEIRSSSEVVRPDPGARHAPRRPGRRHPRRPAGGDVRAGLPRGRRGQEHLRHRQLRAAQHRHARRCQSKNGLLTTVCYKIGDAAADLRARGLDRGHRLAGAVAARQPRDDLARRPRSRTLAKTVDDNGGAYFVPAFSGLFAPYWRADARGAIVGLTRYVNKGHLARAVLEATAFQTREVIDAMNADSGRAAHDAQGRRRHGRQRDPHAVPGRHPRRRR